MTTERVSVHRKGLSSRAMALGLMSGVMIAGAAPGALAQGSAWPSPEGQMQFDVVPPEGAAEANSGISMRAQIDVMFEPVDGGPTVLIQKAFETGSAGQNVSSQYVFEVLNSAALAGLDQALLQGARSGRVSVVAVCYQYGVSEEGAHSLLPMGVFINTTDMNVLADGNAAFRTAVKFIPPFDGKPAQDRRVPPG